MYFDPTGHWRSGKEAIDAWELWERQDYNTMWYYGDKWNELNELYKQTGDSSYLDQRDSYNALADDLRAKYQNLGLTKASIPEGNSDGLLVYDPNIPIKTNGSTNSSPTNVVMVVESDLVYAGGSACRVVNRWSLPSIPIPNIFPDLPHAELYIDINRVGQFGLGALQTAGGVLETAGGIGMYASTVIDGPLGIAAGTYLTVNGVSTTTGGISMMVNSALGNGKGETWNFVKNGCNAISPQYGDTMYLGTQIPGIVYGGHQLVSSGMKLYKNWNATKTTSKAVANIYSHSLKAAESGELSYSSIIRMLRQINTPEARATEKYIKRGLASLKIVNYSDYLGYVSRGSKEIVIARNFKFNGSYMKQDLLTAAGTTGHEALHVMQKVAAGNHNKLYELDAFIWQSKIDSKLQSLSIEALWELINNNKAYTNEPFWNGLRKLEDLLR